MSICNVPNAVCVKLPLIVIFPGDAPGETTPPLFTAPLTIPDPESTPLAHTPSEGVVIVAAPMRSSVAWPAQPMFTGLALAQPVTRTIPATQFTDAPDCVTNDWHSNTAAASVNDSVPPVSIVQLGVFTEDVLPFSTSEPPFLTVTLVFALSEPVETASCPPAFTVTDAAWAPI